MKFTLINGTNRLDNRSIEITKAAAEIVKDFGHDGNIVTLDNFDQLFRGDYINLSNASEVQKIDLENMAWADILIFVVPTYHHGIPSSLKNFLDIINDVSVFEGKKVGFVSVSHGVYGIMQTKQIINGIFSYNGNKSYILPKDCIVSPYEIEKEKLEEYIKYCIDW
ncbi:hypothetical protein CO058_00670 [candidate division WWE3 bacterium CG_4_9_14_0_2_um_filter_35_11]|uniref:NADPH-dependent FMN reductase-like domain-containing protein n=1 Tax=candidate division WWE3 bacterium CG_4_9_14_0_2_um_filter_35_11 TaxID=1975077 RepID=A0A2M8EMG9_UNCKA|nr:MAG: hypothetical protein COV25_02210 [candidate division WWE3 bacterium CG10_big_fil_rev_8_21_14_0_10_35_32]PJC23915.1 MAG: hypothetical protein CO058_00670 [candidate division WWE3 bacterium CG_4_9_14_0_2_um_filter_35_11]